MGELQDKNLGSVMSTNLTNSSFAPVNMTIDSQVSDDNVTTHTSHGSDHLKVMFNFYVSGVVSTTFLLLGVVGNVLSVCVLRSARMRRGGVSVCRLLLCLGVYDILFLVCHGLAGNMPQLLYHAGHALPPVLLVTFALAYPMLHIARTGSVYVTVLVTLERYVAVAKPLKAAILFTHARTTKILVFVFLLSVVFNIPRCMEHVITRDPSTQMVTVAKSEFHSTVFYSKIYLIYLNFAFHFAIPFTLIAVFNALIVYTLRKVCNRESIGLQLTARSRTSQESGHKLTAVVLAITTTFFLCHLVPAIALVLEQAEGAQRVGDCSVICSSITSLGECLIIVCSATNFVLYCVFGRKFRRVFTSLFCPCATSNRGSGPHSSTLVSLKSTSMANTSI